MNIENELFKDAAKDAIAPLGRFLKKKYGHVLVDFDTCFTKYLARSYEYYSVTKTLISKHEPICLSSIYINLDYSIGDRIVSGEMLLDEVVKFKTSIIFGTAGSGKSVLARMLFMSTITNRTGYIPILIELRYLLNIELERNYIEQYIFEKINSINSAFTYDQLEYALTKGKFLLIMDGFDEIDTSFRSQIAKNIQAISFGKPNSVIVVTSRHDEQIESWHEFNSIFAKPMTEKQAVLLLKKIDFSEVVKGKLIDRLEDDLFDKRSEFLSNPLLLTIMLLTFDELADIPSKMHIYYEHAFNTLYFKHDSRKRAYHRHHYSTLEIDDFKRVFSAFCFQSYIKSKYRFTHSEVLDLLRSSFKLEGFADNNSSSVNILKDLTESVCLLQQDGFEYTFVHRSFQEYFGAEYICRTSSLNVIKVFDHIVWRTDGGDFINLLYDMDRELVETQWILPRLDILIEELSQDLRENNYLDFVQKFVIGASSSNKHPRIASITVTAGPNLSFYHYLERYDSLLKPHIYKSDNVYIETHSTDIIFLFSGEFFEKHCKSIPPDGDILPGDMQFEIYDFSLLNLEAVEYSRMYPEGFFQNVLYFLMEIQKNLTEKYLIKANSLDSLFLNMH